MWKVKEIDVVIYVLYLALFKVYAIPQEIQQATKIIFIVIVLFYIICRAKNHFVINNVLVLDIGMLISCVLAYESGNVGIQSIYNGLLHCICLYISYVLIKYCVEIGYWEGLIKVLFKITSVYCIISLISMIYLGHSDNGTEIVYFFGYKFMTSYYFLFWLALFRTKYQEEIESQYRYRVLYLFLIICVFGVCKWLYCSTATIAVVFLFLEQFLPHKIKDFLFQRKTILVSMVLAGVVPLVIEMILKNKFVQYIIVELLQKDLNMTGRLRIFTMITRVIKQRPVWGYGYGNIAVETFVGFGNAQNGLMQQLVDYGFVGLIVFLLSVFIILTNKKHCSKINGLYSMIYVLIICSIVEISYNYLFYITLFLIGAFLQKNYREKGSK